VRRSTQDGNRVEDIGRQKMECMDTNLYEIMTGRPLFFLLYFISHLQASVEMFMV
jgi:hypothetical protein